MTNQIKATGTASPVDDGYSYIVAWIQWMEGDKRLVALLATFDLAVVYLALSTEAFVSRLNSAQMSTLLLYTVCFLVLAAFFLFWYYSMINATLKDLVRALRTPSFELADNIERRHVRRHVFLYWFGTSLSFVGVGLVFGLVVKVLQHL